jgi:hypothetical protein
MTAECGQPGRLYPFTDADALALAAADEGWAHKRGLKSLFQVSMIARCAQHRPSQPPARFFTGQRVPCGYADPIANPWSAEAEL